MTLIDVFLSEGVFQVRDELDDLGETVTNERLTTTFLDALPEDMYSIVKMQSIKAPDLGLEEIMDMMKNISINHSERSSVLKRSLCMQRFYISHIEKRFRTRPEALPVTDCRVQQV